MTDMKVQAGTANFKRDSSRDGMTFLNQMVVVAG